MLQNLPSTPQTLINWKWEEIEPHYTNLVVRPLTATALGFVMCRL